MIAADLNKQQSFDADRKAIQPINFTRNLEENAGILFIIEAMKETVLDFPQGTIKYSNFVFVLI